MSCCRIIFLAGCIIGLLGNGQIEASEKADNAFLMAQSKGPFVLEADDLFPAVKAKPVLKKKVPAKKPRTRVKSSPSKNKTSAKKTKVPTKSKSQKLKGVRVIPSSVTQKKAYVFGPEDELEISVWENPDLKSSMPVRPDGFISFPLIGDVLAQGLTPAQLKERITGRLKKFITDPIVTVVVKTINSIKISVAGEVNEPDSYQVNRPITLLHLFALAQGFTEKADLKRSYLLRSGKKLNIDFFALVKQDDFSQNIWLQSGDLVFIHDNFDGRINIMGEIKLPQVVSFQEGMTVLDAILMANGLTDIAKPEGTKVYRKNRAASGNSEIQIISVEMGRVIFEGDLSENIRLQPGDIIHVPRSFF
ncbi:MAG: polysaccharide export outer membrane protein [Nitrospinales bacterium]|jgi:polysaccharide export outer membrane protein